jgi:hypothetical protein
VMVHGRFGRLAGPVATFPILGTTSKLSLIDQSTLLLLLLVRSLWCAAASHLAAFCITRACCYYCCCPCCKLHTPAAAAAAASHLTTLCDGAWQLGSIGGADCCCLTLLPPQILPHSVMVHGSLGLVLWQQPDCCCCCCCWFSSCGALPPNICPTL